MRATFIADYYEGKSAGGIYLAQEPAPGADRWRPSSSAGWGLSPLRVGFARGPRLRQGTDAGCLLALAQSRLKTGVSPLDTPTASA